MKRLPHLSFLLGLVLCACTLSSHADERVLELKDVLNFQQDTSVTPDGRKVDTISGLCGHSAYVVSSFEVVKHADSLQVLVHIRSTDKEGLSGSFQESFEIPDTVDTVTFGREDEVIWQQGKD
ncbi:MAG: hypothetical protein ACQKBW_02440 [Puniceicoccales bacterium]